MATEPQFAATPILEVAQISTANTNRDGTGTIVTLASGTDAGKRISRVTIQATGTTTGGMIRFYFSPDGGTTNRLIGEVAVIAATPSGTVSAFSTLATALAGLILPGTSAQLRASTHNAETFNILVESGGL
jgi:hypothetical protein